MEARNRFVILLALVLFASVPVQSANQPEAVQISSAHTASCLVKITFDPLVLPLDSITIDYLLHSSSVQWAPIDSSLSDAESSALRNSQPYS